MNNMQEMLMGLGGNCGFNKNPNTQRVNMNNIIPDYVIYLQGNSGRSIITKLDEKQTLLETMKKHLVDINKI